MTVYYHGPVYSLLYFKRFRKGHTRSEMSCVIPARTSIRMSAWKHLHYYWTDFCEILFWISN
jgi:hypothetical protein